MIMQLIVPNRRIAATRTNRRHRNVACAAICLVAVVAAIALYSLPQSASSLPAFIDSAFAQAPAGDQQVFGPAPVVASDQPTFFSALTSMLPMLAVCYMIFYFMVLRPQDTKTKTHKALIESLKKGDQVVTSSGIVGKIVGMEKEFVLLEIATNVKIKVQQTHVTKRLGDEAKAEAA